MNEPSTKDMLEHAWRYFSLHASQRISLFNFFLIAEGTMTAGLAACIQGPPFLNLLGTSLGALMTLAAFAFWRLDQRTTFLVKHAEDSLAELENALPIVAARVISQEPARTAARGGVGQVWTYSEIFRVVFVVAALVGISGGALCLFRFITRV